ncbi:ABC transporter substrate-binding protein [Microvirga sp. KLBC 81]|uniref:ABC transporter substrate-binding protein n=1 Tax=Microvirga sp. KLBC 81 TaxID=1862707 RepID=UPI000D521E65|nr:ABC transporter substrate-binding protein [Microvirga sp. KLBC 81]PVE24187.1 ABC transporter substrate-binding protein [Microvirga sp. KLBC 81]
MKLASKAMQRLSWATAILAVTAIPALAQDVPAAYPADYANVIAAAKKEGTVTIYTSTDQAQAQPFLDAFAKKFPGIKVEYNDLGTNGAYNRVISEAAAGQVGADVVWSSAMDYQVSLVKGGHTEAYKSPEASNVPDWGKYKDTLYATSVEPIGIIYNTKALPENRVPKTRAELIKFLQDNKSELKGKVATFDPEKSGSGFLHHTNDARQTKDFWDLAKAFGAVSGRTYSSSGSMKETVVSGENVIAFNIIGSYGLQWVKESPNLGVAFGKDYTPAFSRVALITKKAPHPNAAKVLVDFMLSKEGQTALAAGGIPSVRTDVEQGFNLKSLTERVGGNLKPIALDDHLLEYLNPQKRVQFFREWKASLSGS